MTDEEMAEKYVKSVIDVNGFDWKIVREICLAYLAGLKADRPQWHDLRENPNDLPKDKCDVLDENGNTLHYDSGYFYKEYIFCTKEYPIAWCEIPTFDKE